MTATIRSELAAAVRGVNVAYHRLPEDRRPDVGWNALDDVLEAALTAPDRSEARAAVAEWKTHWLSLFEEAAR